MFAIVALIVIVAIGAVIVSTSKADGSQTVPDPPVIPDPSPGEEDPGGTGVPPPVKGPEERIDEGSVSVGPQGNYSQGFISPGMTFSVSFNIFHRGPTRKVIAAIALGVGGGFLSHQNPETIPQKALFTQSVILEGSDTDQVTNVFFTETWPELPGGKYDVLRIVAPLEVSSGSVTLLIGGRYDDDWDDGVFETKTPNNQVSIPDSGVSYT